MNPNEYEMNGEVYTISNFNCIVEMEMLPKDDKLGGTMLHNPYADQDWIKQQKAHNKGFLRAVGKDAWYDKTEPAAKIGDKVVFTRYAGEIINYNKKFDGPEGESFLVIMKDVEILGTVKSK